MKMTARQPVVRDVRANSDSPAWHARAFGERRSVGPFPRNAIGASHLTQVYPMLKSLGNFHLTCRNQILDDAWRVAEMGIPNNHFRLI